MNCSLKTFSQIFSILVKCIETKVIKSSSSYTAFPHKYSFRGNYSFLNLEIQRSQYIRPKVTIHNCVEIIQGRKLYEEIRYLYKLEICLRPSFPGIQSCIVFTVCKVSNSLFSIHGMVDALASVQRPRYEF